MMKLILLFGAIMLFTVALYAQKTSKSFCITTNNSQINADIYILFPDELEGQLLSGQFCQLAGNLENASMSNEEVVNFLEHEGKSLIKYYGDAYCIIKNNKNFFLAELIRNEDESFEPIKLASLNTTIVNKPSFLNLIIPRNKK